MLNNDVFFFSQGENPELFNCGRKLKTIKQDIEVLKEKKKKPKLQSKPIKRKIWDPSNREYSTREIQRKFPR